MNIIDGLKIINKMGLPWTSFRIKYEIKRKTGILKRKFPINDFSDDDFTNKIQPSDLKSKTNLASHIKENRDKFVFSTQDLDGFKQYLDTSLSKEDKDKVIKIADDAMLGKIYCFNRWTADFGNPINWHKNPITNYEWDNDRHWVDIEELSNTAGDIKYVWEASRFTQVFYFVRAYTITQDEKYADAFWEQIEHWLAENPYELGIHWKCGQEISFRTFAWIFGLYAFLDSPSTSDDRIFMLMKNIYFNAIHVEKNIDFAIRAVQNNHSISEAACLFTAGALFPFYKDSEKLLKKGKRYLEQEGLKQIFSDGSYIQDSSNYHRLMLQDYTWAYRLAKLNNICFSDVLTNRLRQAIDFLYQMQDDQSGMVPNYGANDGALVFPLTSCDYLNYKPQLNTINYILNGKKLYKNGKHEEDLLWFCGKKAVNSAELNLKARENKRYDIGGYYILRANNSFGMVRCTKFDHRPGQADMLHFDLWYKGVNVLTDIGSYSYNPEVKYKDYFRKTNNHNTITINDANQMRKGPRFLTLDWTEGYLNRFDYKEDKSTFSGYHTAYKNTHIREIVCQKDSYIITDHIKNDAREKINIKINWNIGTSVEKLEEQKYKLIIDDQESIIFEISSLSNGKINMYYGDEDKPAGWRSLYYGEKIPVNQLVYEIESQESKEEVVTKVHINHSV